MSEQETPMGDVKKETAPTLAEALRMMTCPRPCNHRPDDLDVGQCVDAGECGCVAGNALRQPDTSEGGGEPFAYTTPSIVEGFSDPKTIVGSIWPTHVAGKYATVPLYLAPPLNKSPNPEHVEGDVSVGELEATVWEGYWPGAGSIDSITSHTKSEATMKRWANEGAEIEPLVTLSSAHSSIQRAERDRDSWRRVAERLEGEKQAAEAQLVEARKVLERIKAVVTYPCDTSIQARGYSARSIDITGCEYIAEATDALLFTLRENTDAE